MGALWREIGAAIGQDFSDLRNLAHAVQATVRLLIATLLGGLLGYERQRRGRPAGMRTHMLVALGAAFYMLVAEQSGMSLRDLSRVLQGLLTGIGFLGAGVILKTEPRREVRGLTTAAGLWLTAALGMAAGLGRLSLAILGAVLALIILVYLRRFEQTIEPGDKDRPS
ncbi:MAG: MgtC/SapB family protein [Isosphaeraceae bacterium]|nr:MgtC/SapB family protein [Isosphaeraceae bacterium]